MMTCKDHRALAAALKSEQPRAIWSAAKHAQYTQDVHAIAQVLADDNSRFDYARFCEAAGLVREGPGVCAHSVHKCSSTCDCQQKAT